MDLPSLVVLSTPSARYFADLVMDGLQQSGHSFHFLDVERHPFADGEKYYRLAIRGNFDLLGKTAIYVCPLLDDGDILEVYRIGSTLSQLGIRRRIFLIPFMAYTTMERAVKPGEVVTGKLTIQMLSSIGAGIGNVFVMLDLHTSGLLHYFEGSCTRLELYGQKVLEQGLPLIGFERETFMFASGDLGRSAWVNAFARDNGTGVAFIRKMRIHTAAGVSETQVCEVIGSVKDKHVVIYDDMTRSGGTLIHAAEEYLRAGALSVDVLVTHLRVIGRAEIESLLRSQIRKIVTTNSCPITQDPMISGNERFIVLDVSSEFVKMLGEVIPPALVGSAGCLSAVASSGTFRAE